MLPENVQEGTAGIRKDERQPDAPHPGDFRCRTGEHLEPLARRAGGGRCPPPVSGGIFRPFLGALRDSELRCQRQNARACTGERSNSAIHIVVGINKIDFPAGN